MQWKAAATHIDDYDGSARQGSLTETSKRQSQKAHAYDGMQAVASGFWASDRSDEKRVDLLDHKIYTWRQYRLKHSGVHSWTLEQKWKKLPTLKSVKNLGKQAFIQRFR
jgi:hypothetical protein